MSDQDLIAAFLAKKAVTVVNEGVAYGVDKEADKAKRNQARMERAYNTPKPNWRLQAKYDAMHGTVNGYDEKLMDQLAMYEREQ